MRVLFLSALYPFPVVSGGHVRLVNLLKRLSLAHEIHLLSFTRSSPSDEDRKKVSELCFSSYEINRGKVWQLKYIYTALTSSMSLLQSSYTTSLSRSTVTKLLASRNFDIIHVEPLYLAQLVPVEYLSKTVIVEHNIEYQVYQTYINRFKIIYPLHKMLAYDVNKLHRNEKSYWNTGAKIITVSEEDRKVIEKSSGRSDISVVSNAVATNEVEYVETSRSNKNVIFVGYFGWFPNLVAVTELIRNTWPFIRSKLPELTLTIIGKNLPGNLQKEAKKLNIEVKGWVPDISEYFKHATALIAPFSIGGGTKFKILEAMAYGCPVIGTDAAFSGIHVDFVRHGWKVKSSSEYVHALKTILTDESERLRVTRSARKLIEENYSWEKSALNLEKIWKSV